jgi:hypothetical protein
MLVHKAYKFRIYPDATQEELFLRTIGCCRLVYNLCLDQKKLERERSNPWRLTAFDQMKELTSLKREFSSLKEPPSQTLQQAIHDLHKAFKNFFEGRAGFPTFRKKGQNDAFRYPVAKQISIEEDRIFLPKAGWTEMVMHRPIVGEVKNITVSVIAGDWFVWIQVEHAVAVVPINRGVEIGIDLGGVQPIVLSDGTVIHLPRTTTADRKRLADAQDRGPADEGVSQPGESPAQSGQVAGQVCTAQEGRRAQGNHDARQEPRRHRHRGPKGQGDDQKRQRYGCESGQACSEASEPEPIAARRVTADDPEHAGIQGALVRIPDHRHRSGGDLAVLQRLRYRRCGKPHQPVPLRLHQLRQHIRCRRQRGKEHPEARHQPNRRTSGDGL